MEPLARLFRPASIAVIGGGSWCANVIGECRRIGFGGPVWPVHPSRDEVAGLPAFASVEALPGAPDAAFVGVNRETSVEVVRALAARGAGGAVCFASGFREATAETADGARLEAGLVAAAGSMRILGPNCYGMLNALDGAALWPDQHGCTRVARGVALITQSSNIAINLTMQARGLDIAYVVTVGNQAQTDLAEIGIGLLEDPRVTALGLHVEGIGDAGRFRALALRARDLGKPIVGLKVGASDHARAAAISHTGALAGSAAGARALFDRLGIGWVEGLAALLETLKLLHAVGPLDSNRVASLSCSGGEAGLMADRGAQAGLVFPPLTATQTAALRAALGPRVALANPLDYHTYIWGDRAAMARAFTAMMEPHLALGIVVLDFPRADRCDAAAWDIVIDAAADAMAASGRPIAILSSLPETMPEPVARRILARGLVPLNGMEDGLAAVAVAARTGRVAEAPPPLWARGRIEAGATLSEADAKAALAAHGLDIPRSARGEGADAAVAAAREIGFPVALKGEGAAHKTEAGLVRLGLDDEATLREAAAEMPAATFLVEEMITGGVTELIVGVLRDPAHGFVLTLGAGGVLAEILRDSVSMLVPAGEDEIRAALGRLKLAPLLAGYRGAPPADLTAIVRAVMAVQSCVVAEAARVIEVEVNPLICTPARAVAADALIRLGGLE